MSKTNCYRFTTNPGGSDRTMQMIAGLIVEKTHPHGKTNYFVRLQSEYFGYEVPATSDIVVAKPDGNKRIYRADLIGTEYTGRPQEVGLELVSCHTHCNKTLILISSYYDVVCNIGVSRPHFNKVGTWIGADGPGLVLQAGSHQSPLKKQLFCLKEGESILFFDSKKEVTKITAKRFGERPTLERATNMEVAKYALSEAVKRGDNPKTRGWVFYALQELGCQKQIEEFCRKYPNFCARL